MNYKLQAHFLNDVSTWRTHIPALITMDIIKSLFLHQCRLHSNVYGFKIVQKSFIQSSSNLQEANHLGFSCQQKLQATHTKHHKRIRIQELSSLTSKFENKSQK